MYKFSAYSFALRRHYGMSEMIAVDVA